MVKAGQQDSDNVQTDSPSADGRSTGEPSFAILPWPFFKWLVAIVVIVVVGGTAANFGIYHIAANPESNFVAGAIGMEMVAALIFDQAGSENGGQRISHTIAQSIEEPCEMLGVAIFVYALLDYLATNFPIINIHLEKMSSHSATN